MKKLLSIIIVTFAFLAVSNAQIVYPFSSPDFRTSTDSLTSAVDNVWDNLTYIDYATLDTNLTVTATIDDDIRDGALLYFELTADASARTVVWSTNLTGGNTTVTANKTLIIGFIYNGSAFKLFTETTVD